MEQATVSKHTSATGEPRNRLVAFLLNLSLGYFGLHQVYLGNKTQGWVRFGLGVASFPLMIILVGFLIVPVLVVWQIVDFFLLQLSTKVDGEGQTLHASKRDASWQKGIFIAVIAVFLLQVFVGILLVATGIMAMNQNGFNGRFNFDSSTDSSYFQDF